MIGVDTGDIKETLTNTFANWPWKDVSPHFISISEPYRWYLFSEHKSPLWLSICQTNSKCVKVYFCKILI